jgi:hypothetical protein
MKTVSYTKINNKEELKTVKEEIKTLKVIGEAVGQVVVEGTIHIDAIKIIKIDAELRDVMDFVFENKVVKQGIVHKQVFFVDHDGLVRETEENIPFMLVVDIPGVQKTPFTEVQNHLLDIDTDFVLTPATEHSHGTLLQKVVAHILVRVSEWSIVDVVTKVDIFPKVNANQRSSCFCK